MVGEDVAQRPASVHSDSHAVEGVVLDGNPVLLLVVGEEGADGHTTASLLDAVAARVPTGRIDVTFSHPLLFDIGVNQCSLFVDSTHFLRS